MQLTPQFLLTLLAVLATALTMGSWATAAFLRPRTTAQGTSLAGDRMVLAGQLSAVVGVLAAGGLVATGDELLGTKPWQVAAVAGLLSVLVGLVRRWEAAIYVIGLQAIAVSAPVITAAARAPHNHDITTDADFFASLATALLAGSWLASRALPDEQRSSAPTRARLCWLSTVVAAVVAVCELAIIWGNHASGGLDANARWHLLRLACVLGIAALSWIPATVAGLGAALLGLLALVFGVAAHRTLPASAALPAAPDITAFGYSVAEWPTLYNMVLNGRLNLLFAGLAVLAVVSYLLLVRRLHARGEHWPVGRTAAWIIGWLIVVAVTSSGVGRYAAAVFSVHMFLNLALNMLCAMVLCLGGFVTLVLRATPARGDDEPAGLHEWMAATMRSRVLGLLYNPIIALAFMTGSYYVFYLSGLFTASLQTHWLAQYFYLHFLVSGYIFYGLVIGVDQPPHPLPHIGKLGLIIGAMPFHAFFGVTLMAKGTIFGGDFLESLGYHWQTARGLLHDQWVGGTIAWAGGEFPLTVALAALMTQWKRQDRSESRTVDRDLDSGDDESYDAYNEMLAQLAERDRTQHG